MTLGKRLWLAAAAVLVLAAGLRVVHHFNRPHLLHPGDHLVPLAVSSLDGQEVVLAPPGHAELINVFATWCPPCRMEAPAIVSLAKSLQSRGIQVVGIDQQEGATQVERFRDEFRWPYPLYIDGGDLTHTVLGARVIPETVFVGADGVIQWIREGPLTPQDFESIRAAEKTV